MRYTPPNTPSMPASLARSARRAPMPAVTPSMRRDFDSTRYRLDCHAATFSLPLKPHRDIFTIGLIFARCRLLARQCVLMPVSKVRDDDYHAGSATHASLYFFG